MKYLDEDIIIKVQTQIHEDGVYQYRVYIGSKLIFVGNTFLQSGITYKDFYLNDILNNYHWKGEFTDGYNNGLIETVKIQLDNNGGYDYGTEEVMFIHRYPHNLSHINTPLIPSSTSSGDFMPLLLGSDWRNRKLLLPPTYPFNNGTLQFKYLGLYSDNTINQDLVIRNSKTGSETIEQFVVGEEIDGGIYGLSSYNIGDLCTLTASDVTEDDLSIGFASSVNTKYDKGKIYVTPGAITPGTTTITNCIVKTYTKGSSLAKETITNPSTSISLEGITSLSVTFNSNDVNMRRVTYTVNSDKCPDFDYDTTTNVLTIGTDDTVDTINPDEIVIRTNNNYDVVVAKIDRCSRYFVSWVDRYGGIQIQPFEGTTTFKESIERKTITDYKGYDKNIGITTSPKWTLNTKWINQKYYPIYEGIFVSPTVQLYDAIEDKLYDVVVEDSDYTEKTFMNQSRNLFNLQLNVVLSKKQNMIF